MALPGAAMHSELQCTCCHQLSKNLLRLDRTDKLKTTNAERSAQAQDIAMAGNTIYMAAGGVKSPSRLVKVSSRRRSAYSRGRGSTLSGQRRGVSFVSWPGGA